MTNLIPANTGRNRGRMSGWIRYWQKSRSGGWGTAKSNGGKKYFIHRSSFLDATIQPRIGMRIAFTPIPKKVTGLHRAIEVAVIPRRNHGTR